MTMRWVHKEHTQNFLLGELRLAFVSRLVDDETGEAVGLVAAAMTSPYDSLSLRNFFTNDSGTTFHATSYRVTPRGIVMLVNENAEMGSDRVESLRLALEKWLEAT